jgi:hypothetical protein
MADGVKLALGSMPRDIAHRVLVSGPPAFCHEREAAIDVLIPCFFPDLNGHDENEGQTMRVRIMIWMMHRALDVAVLFHARLASLKPGEITEFLHYVVFWISRADILRLGGVSIEQICDAEDDGESKRVCPASLDSTTSRMEGCLSVR